MAKPLRPDPATRSGSERRQRTSVLDQERNCAIPDSFNYRKHEEVARDLERRFGHARVQGAHAEREGVERPPRTPSMIEMQAARTKIDPRAVGPRSRICSTEPRVQRPSSRRRRRLAVR